MTITLDDVCCLLHLPLGGSFWQTPLIPVTIDRGIEMAVHWLGCTQQEAVAETRISKGAYFRHEWLINLCKQKIESEEYVFAARAYLLFLLGSTIFSGKMFNRVEAKWLHLLEDFQACGSWAWAPAALAFLYDQLNDASFWSTAQMGGYASLMTCWIYEYFPNLVTRKDFGLSVGPRASRWGRKKDDVTLATYRERLDALTVDDIKWRPFDDHREQIPHHVGSLFRGHLMWGDLVVPYMPDRCLRQFGYIQNIPMDPLVGKPSNRDILMRWNNWIDSVQQLVTRVVPVRYPSECTETYLPWYYRVSVPRLFHVHVAGVPPRAEAEHQPQAGAERQPERRITLPEQRLEVISQRLRELLGGGQIRPRTPEYAALWSLLDIAEGGDF